MKKLLASVLALGLLLAGCGSAAESTTVSDDAPPADIEVEDTAAPPPGGERPDRGQRPDEDDENTVLGKVTAISDSEITVDLAQMAQPQLDGDDSRPDLPDGSMPERPADKADGSAPEPPGDGEAPGGRGGDGQGPGGGRMAGDLEYTGESATYLLAADVEIRAGGPGEEDSSDTAIAVGDTVRLTLDDDGNVTAILAMSEPLDGDGSEEESADKSESGV